MRRTSEHHFSGHFDRFTDRARQVLSLAQEEAERLGHNYVGTEHLLLGLVREGDGVAAKVLSNLGVELNKVRSAVEMIVRRGDRVALGDIGLTPRSKKVLELAVDESRRLNHHYIGTEHLLLGLVREGEGIAAGVLESLGVNLEKVRTQTIQVLSQRATNPEGAEEAEAPTPPSPPPGAGPKNNVVTCRLDDRAVDALDALVEAGVRSTRSDAAAWLIAAGMDAHQTLFDRLAATIQTIRQLRQEAQTIAHEVVSAPPPNATGQPTVLGEQAHVMQDGATNGGEGDEDGDGDGDGNSEGGDSPPQPPPE